MVANTSISVSLTGGVAYIQDYASIDERIKRADNLLYKGKNLGREQALPMLFFSRI
jgi:PleD family two-component response regulator